MTDEPTTGNLAPSVDVDRLVERYHDLAVRTQNPVYGWLALEALLAPTAGSQVEKPQDDVAIPGWIAAYLHDAASRLNCLASGMNYKTELPPFDFSLFVSEDGAIDREEVFRSPEWQQHMKTVEVGHKKAMAEVPNALGFVQGTRNQFERFQSVNADMQEARFYEAATEAGVASKVALEAISKGSAARGKTDTQILARIRNVRRLL